MPPRNIVIGQNTPPELAQRARELRSNQTPAEQVLWEKLRGNRLNGWHFRRQQIIGGYIVDFYCPRAGLAVELDGGIHGSQREYDADRDRTLTTYRIRVLRFTNQMLEDDLSAVLARIQAACEENNLTI
ncbi:DUF559 domain-containing protein [bacterium]|nr:MAG: DUF559 domain-containing protein [bacterium]